MSEPAPAADADDLDADCAYVEPARSYRSAWLLVLVLLVGFGIDLGIDVHGAITHLPGWLIAFALVVGIDLLVIHAARSTKSLRVDAEHVRVGDEAVERAAIVSATSGGDDELPVLGWPTGLPRATRAVTLTLTDGSSVVVPTHEPDRLRAVLGAVESTESAVDVRPAADADLDRIPEIDERAEAVFHVAGFDLPRIPFDIAGLHEAAAVFVAGRPVVGFVQVDEVDGAAHVAELSVLPSAMRHGHGGRLLEQACVWAAEQGYDAVTLITYADVPWNAPFYAARGFVEVAADTPELARRRARQTELGLDDVGRRIVMRRRLGP